MAASGQIVPSPPFPLSAARADALAELVRGLDAPELLWISGYTAGLAAASHATWGVASGAAAVTPTAAPPTSAADAPWVATIVYGSQTGNGRRIAEALAERLLSSGVRARVLRGGEYATK